MQKLESQTDKPVTFVSWSVEDILELLEMQEESLDMTDTEIQAALEYAAGRGYNASRCCILDSIKYAHKVLTEN